MRRPAPRIRSRSPSASCSWGAAATPARSWAMRHGTPSSARPLRPGFLTALPSLMPRARARFGRAGPEGALQGARRPCPAGRRRCAPARRSVGRVQAPVRPGVRAPRGAGRLRLVLMLSAATPSRNATAFVSLTRGWGRRAHLEGSGRWQQSAEAGAVPSPSSRISN